MGEVHSHLTVEGHGLAGGYACNDALTPSEHIDDLVSAEVFGDFHLTRDRNCGGCAGLQHNILRPDAQHRLRMMLDRQRPFLFTLRAGKW